MIQIKYIYSRLTSDSVTELVAHYYDNNHISSCEFYVLGLHDNYLIQCKNEAFILRIYRNDWRTQEEIGFELELLNYLRGKEQSIAYPLPTKNNKLSFEISSPEGKRVAALFVYADGEAVNRNISIEQSKILGASIANIHEATNNFKTKNTRNNLDLAYLVDQSLVLIEPYVNSKQYQFLESVKETIVNNLSHLNTNNADFGICIGDVNQTNFHINKAKKITVFDFDQCGYGYRVFELGKFLSSIHFHKNKQEKMEAFVKGYETVRQLTNKEKETIPYFEISSVIWVMSIRVANKNKVGHINLEKSYWDQKLGIIKSLVEKLP